MLEAAGELESMMDGWGTNNAASDSDYHNHHHHLLLEHELPIHTYILTDIQINTPSCSIANSTVALSSSIPSLPPSILLPPPSPLLPLDLSALANGFNH